LKRLEVGLIPYPMLGPNNNYCAPNKLYEYAQSNLPMLSTPQQTFIDVFERFSIGKVVAMDEYMAKNTKAIADKITGLIEHPPSPELFDEFNSIYSFANESQRLEEYLDKYI
jgi:hypothetical protein